MVYTINLKWQSYKQDITNIDKMLSDQASTYAILRYAYDIPDSIYKRAMNLLLACMDQITNRKLSKLTHSYAGVAKVGLVMDEELVETIEIPVGIGFSVEDRKRGITLMIDEDED